MSHHSNNIVIPIESDPHLAVQALLPWYALERLEGAELALVREHLAHCAGCRAELEAERALQAALAESRDEPLPDTEAALGRMRTLLDKAQQRPPQPRTRAWMPWALGLQSMAIAALLVVVGLRPASDASAPYRGLSAPPSARGEALLMFRPGATEAAIRRVLLAHHAVIVGGPTESGAYRISLPQDAQELAGLRAEPIVSLAESLAPSAR